MPEIDADGADRRGITQTDADVVRVKRSKVMKSNTGKNIASVIERNDVSPFLIGSGMRASALMTSSSLPPLGTLICGQLGAVCPVLQTYMLRCGPAPSSGKPRSESPPPVKKASLRGTRLFGIGLGQTYADAVGPHDVVELLFIESGLRSEFCKVDAARRV